MNDEFKSFIEDKAIKEILRLTAPITIEYANKFIIARCSGTTLTCPIEDFDKEAFEAKARKNAREVMEGWNNYIFIAVRRQLLGY